ncbi:hypothetical protein [Gillisia sp. JM1]|uniref:hypothetical protein n=1 Tax=Gillisia sp. JM1 TaxID=1283286 RepID=UPI0012DFA6E3|nr:hypothetical protein [Gillisia sp. JM1]
MTETTFHIASHQIKFKNSIFSKEKVILDGEEKSSRYSINGTNHKFKIESEDFSIITKYNMFDKSVIQLKLLKGNDLIQEKSVKLSFKDRFPWIILGIISGIIFYQLLNLIVKVI